MIRIEALDTVTNKRKTFQSKYNRAINIGDLRNLVIFTQQALANGRTIDLKYRVTYTNNKKLPSFTSAMKCSKRIINSNLASRIFESVITDINNSLGR